MARYSEGTARRPVEASVAEADRQAAARWEAPLEEPANTTKSPSTRTPQQRIQDRLYGLMGWLPRLSCQRMHRFQQEHESRLSESQDRDRRDVQRSFSQGLTQRITIQPRQGPRVLSHCIYSVVFNGPQQSSSSLVHAFCRPVELIRIQQNSILSRSWSACDVLDAGEKANIFSPASALSPSMIWILTDYVSYGTGSCRRLIEHNDSGRLLSAMPLPRDSRLLFLSDSTRAAKCWDHVLL